MIQTYLKREGSMLKHLLLTWSFSLLLTAASASSLISSAMIVGREWPNEMYPFLFSHPSSPWTSVSIRGQYRLILSIGDTLTRMRKSRALIRYNVNVLQTYGLLPIVHKSPEGPTSKVVKEGILYIQNSSFHLL